jgi:hypothetical protein
MAGSKRLQAVPVVFLWIALCFPGTPSGAPAAGAVRDAAFSVVLSAPSGTHAQLIRAKAHKPIVYSGGCLPAAHALTLARPLESVALVIGAAVDPASVLFTCPPLSPRPPPAA